jgi:uncharacterized protein YneF (UPF0154 family)
MIGPEEALLIGIFCGMTLGYALGFFIARSIYRTKTWPY